MSDRPKPAGPAVLFVPLLAFPSGVAVAFLQTFATAAVAAILVYGPLPLLVVSHFQGRKGGWSIAGMAVASLPYLALLAWLFKGGEINHRPL